MTLPLDEDELLAANAGVGIRNFRRFPGRVGTMANGAGLAMATMDAVANAGGEDAAGDLVLLQDEDTLACDLRNQNGLWFRRRAPENGSPARRGCVVRRVGEISLHFAKL